MMLAIMNLFCSVRPHSLCWMSLNGSSLLCSVTKMTNWRILLILFTLFQTMNPNVNQLLQDAPPPGPVFSVLDAMMACGLYEGTAEEVAEAVFMNDFKSCMSISESEMDKTFKSYASLTVNEGRIRLEPLVQKKIKAFNHWVQDKIRLGLSPSMVFPFQDIVAISLTLIKFLLLQSQGSLQKI